MDIYLIRPDGGGLKRISKHGDFCGSPKWSRDGNSVVAYCMSAEDTWTFRTAPEDGETTLMRIQVATGDAKPVKAGPGVKLFAAMLPSGELGFVRPCPSYSTEQRVPGVASRFAGWNPGTELERPHRDGRSS